MDSHGSLISVMATEQKRKWTKPAIRYVLWNRETDYRYDHQRANIHWKDGGGLFGARILQITDNYIVIWEEKQEVERYINWSQITELEIRTKENWE